MDQSLNMSKTKELSCIPTDHEHVYRRRVRRRRRRGIIRLRQRRTRALLDDDQVLILRPNEKFLMWTILSVNLYPSLGGFQLFRLDYLKTLFSHSKSKTIEASKLNKINAEITEAWNDSQRVREKYGRLARSE